MRTAARTSTAVLLALGIALGMTACDLPDPAPTTDPAPGASASGEPSPTPTPEADAGPLPVIGATCDELVPAAALAAAMPAEVVSADAAVSQMTAYPGIAPAYVVRSLGGIACEWNNGEGYSGSAGTNAAYLGLRVQVLPNAATQWDRYLSIYSGTGADAHYCADTLSPLYCSTNALVGTNWIEAEIIGAVSPAAASTLSDGILAALAAAGPGAAAWTPPAGTLPIGPLCTDTLPETVVGLLFGVGVPLTAGRGGGGWSLRAGASVNASTPDCYYAYENTEAGVGSLTGLPAGAWAWREALPSLTTPGVPERIESTLIAEPDEAWLRCSAGDERCILDVIVGGNWFAFDAWHSESGGEPGASTTVGKREALTRIAEAIIGELRG